MTEFIKVPVPEEFSNLVNLYESIYKNLDSIYVTALQDFENKKLSNLNYSDVESILRPYLLKWGKMGRVLGSKGCKRVGDKLREMDLQLTELRQEALSTVDLDRMSSEFVDIYDEIMNTEWKSEKGKTKRVGPTAASKALHLVAPNLFIIWDRAIRNYYMFKENGAEYVRFLVDMQTWLKKLKSPIGALQSRYGKSCTKIIDEYNWKKCNRKPISDERVKDRKTANICRVRKPEQRVRSVLVRSHLLCPYSDCVAHYRKNSPRVQVLLDEERAVSLRKGVSGKSVKTRLPYLNKRWVRLKECPHCDRPLEVVIDETHDGRNIYLRIPQR